MNYLSPEEIWVDRQTRIEKKLHEFTENNYSFNQPKVVLNPYEIAPLTAIAIFQTEFPTSITVSILDKDGVVNLQYHSEISKNHYIPIYGLYANCTNKILLQQEDGQICALEVMTNSIPEDLQKGKVIGTFEKNNWIFTVPISGTGFPAAYDSNGDCRWYLTEQFAFKISKTKDGRLFTCGPALLSPPYSPTSLLEMDLTGKIYKEFRIPGGIYNDFFEMEDGSLLVLNQLFEHGTTEDILVQIDRENGTVLHTWDFRKLLPMNQAGSPSQSPSDWFHASSVFYDTKTNSITVAGKHQDIIINLDYTSGTINWMLGDPTEWPVEFVDRYFFQPVQESFEWCYEMNNASLLPDGTVLCFDNGNQRCKFGGHALEPQKRYSRVVRYAFDTNTKKIEERWSYGKERGIEFFSPYMGNCTVLEENHYFINSGGIGYLNGKCTELPAFFAQASHPEVSMETRILEWKQGKVLYELVIPANCYYAEKINIEQLNHSISLEDGTIVGNRLGSSVFEMDLEWEESGVLDASYQVSAKLTKEQLLVSGCFQQGEMVMLLLDGVETSAYYMQTTKDPYLTMAQNTLTGGSERPLVYAVSLQSLSGSYEICIGIDNKKYHTAIHFDC